MRKLQPLLEHKSAEPQQKRSHKGSVAVSESNRRGFSDGFEFRCGDGEKLQVTFTQNGCDREIIIWAASAGGYDKKTVQDVMLGAIEKRFGQHLLTGPLEQLTDIGSPYRELETRGFARMLGFASCKAAVRSPENNGIVESFVKMIKRDYISIMPKLNSQAAVLNLALVFNHYNEYRPYSVLG